MLRFVVAALAAALVSPAFAHAHLLHETPAADVTGAAPLAAVTLTFSERVELRFTGIAVTGPDGKPVALGTPALDGQGGTVLTVPLSGTATAGAYAVAWHALSADGHKTTGSYRFILK